MEPVKFGKYLLVKQVGMGRIGQLWKAKVLGVKGLEKFLAIKRVHPHLTTERAVIDVFIESASQLVHLQHDSIVRVYDYGTAEGTPYIATDFVVGRGLDDFTKALKKRGQALGLEEALFIVTEVCRAVNFAYCFENSAVKKGTILHGGIRPQNVLLTRDGKIKVTDFCISRVLFEAVEQRQGVYEKTLPYLAPELMKGGGVSAAFDVYCLGVLLCELVTGRPFIDCSVSELMGKIDSGQWDPRERIPEDLAPSLQQILSKAVSFLPGERYQSAGDMLEELQSYSEEIGAREQGPALSKYVETLFGKELALYEEQGGGSVVGTGQRPGVSHENPKQKGDGISRILKNKLVVAVGLAAIIVFVVLAAFWPRPRVTPGPGAKYTGTQVSEKTVQEQTPEGSKAGSHGKAGLSPEAQRMRSRIKEGIRAVEDEQYRRAIKIFGGILRENPGLLQDVATPYAQALEGLGLKLEDKQPKRAMKLLAKAIEINPKSVKGNFHLGLLYVRVKRYPEAIERYRKVIELDPRYADAYFNLGYIYAVTKKYKEAEEVYKQVVSLAPPYLDEALFNLAMIQKSLGKRGESIENLKRAVIVNPKNKLAKKYLAKMTAKYGGD